jgi:hypothetical protein
MTALSRFIEVDIEDRSVTVLLQRKLRTEVTHSFRHGRHPEVDKLKRTHGYA